MKTDVLQDQTGKPVDRGVAQGDHVVQEREAGRKTLRLEDLREAVLDRAYPHFGAQTRWFLPRKRREAIPVRSTNLPHLKHDIMDSARGVVMMEPAAFLT